jgi:hypothetical protein
MKTVQQNYRFFKPIQGSFNGELKNGCMRSLMKPLTRRHDVKLYSTQRANKIANGKFEKYLLEAVDESLSLFGDSTKKAIYFHLEASFNIRRPDIPKKINEFAAAIETIFGEGARVLEIQIMKRLYEKSGRRFTVHSKENDLQFNKYVQMVKSL